MQLRVGELAKHTGLTVRALHHYDAIGLLRPSGRSEAGYRLYSRDDVARLHGIQALRRLGLSLREIERMLAGNGAPLPAIVARQVRALDHEIAQATELRDRLRLLEAKLNRGREPSMDEWLSTLSLMATYSKYFSNQELKKIFENWKHVEAQWPPLIKEVRAAMDAGIAPTAFEVQPLVRRWMQLMVRWMDGDRELMKRWGQMYDREHSVSDKDGPGRAMARYMDKAIQARLALLSKYFKPDELMLLRTDDDAWQELNRDGKALLRRGVAPSSKPAQALLRRWSDLLNQTSGNDPALLQKLLAAHRAEPLLRAGSPVEEPVHSFLQQAQKIGMRAAA